ncbi:MAG: aryl-sulfate sulfotransferase [Candidatus Bathyarchaeota archaeon]
MKIKKNQLILTIVLISIFLLTIGLISAYLLLNTDELRPPEPRVLGERNDYWKGKYVFGFSVSESSMQEIVEQYIVVMDDQGKIETYNRSITHAFSNIDQLSENEIYYYQRPPRGTDEEPEAVIWNYQTGRTRTILQGIDIRGHHEFLIDNGYFITMRRIEKGGLDTVVHLDPETGNETWFWSSEPLFEEKPCDLCSDDDWTHGNDVTISLDSKYYFINFRNSDSFAKVDRETKETIWVAGRNGDFKLYKNGIEKESLWYHSHVIKEIKPNVFLMFDNDFHNRTHLDSYPGTGEDPFEVNYGGRSRLIEITLNETDMTGQITWSYKPPAEYFSAIFGDIDVLPNGNILGVFGTPVHKWTIDHEEIKKPFGAALLEINREGELLREYQFPLGVSIYRVQELKQESTDFLKTAWVLELD